MTANTHTPAWLDLSGKAFLVTGTGSPEGIGYHAALAVGQLGGRLILTSQSSRCLERAEDLNALGIEALAMTCDLTNQTEVERLAKLATDQNLYGLVNNAGMTSVMEPMENTGEQGDLESTSVDQLRIAMARNLETAWRITRATLPKIRANSGRIVNVASVTGPLMAMRSEVSYAAAKAALVGFTKALAVDEASHGVCVNAVAPGWIATASQTEVEQLESGLVPMGRSAKPEEVGRVIAMLGSPAISYITGQLIAVDGGNTIAEQRT